MKHLMTGAAAISLIALSACGGDGSSSAPDTSAPPPTPPAGQTDTYVTVKGEITGFGSVFVNGTRYDTDTASVTKDGETARLSDLSVGQVVALRARRGGDGELPTALRVRYEEVLEGPVDEIAADGSTFIILGQTVFLTDDTVFEDIDPEAIAVGDVLEISGSFTADGDIVASYVEASDNVDGDYEVHGTVGALDTAAQTFRVKGLKIGYASAELADFDDGEVLSNGDRVEVEGSTFTNDGTLIATRVEFEGDDIDELAGEEGDDDDAFEVEIEGFITAFTSSTDFEVDGVPVTTNTETEFEGCDSFTLALDLRVEVEGTETTDGVIVADEVKCRPETNLRTRGAVDAVDVDLGTLTVFGVEYGVTDMTKYQDLGPNKVREFGLDDIQPDDLVELRSYLVLENEEVVGYTASRVQRGDRGKFKTDEVRGLIDSVDDTTATLVVSGVTVSYNDDTKFEIDDDDDIDRADFLAIAVEGEPIKARGLEGEDNILVAEKLSLELEDSDDND